MSGRAGTVTIVWLGARGGRADVARIVATTAVTAVAVVGLLAAACVAWIGPDDGPYTSELLSQPGLHVGVVIALVLLTVPVLALIGQCARIGAPARDRRLAAYRLGGATPRDVVRVVGAETALAAGVGSVLGTAIFLLGRWLLDGPTTVKGIYTRTTVTGAGTDSQTMISEDVFGRVHLLPTDVSLPWWVLAVVAVALPLGSVVFSWLALRRVAVSPFGVVRRADVRPPRSLPAALFVLGTGGLAVFSWVRSIAGLPEGVVPSVVAIAVVLFLVCGIGLILGIAAISAYLGRFVAGRTSRPALLIASRRLAAAPYTSSRANAVILLMVLIGAAAQGVRANFLVITSPEDTLYLDTLNLVNVALLIAIVLASTGALVHTADTVITSRQSLASLAATGVPRAVLRRSLLLESLLPLAPTAVLAAAAGLLASRGILGTTYTNAQGQGRRFRDQLIEVVPIPVPWTEISVLVLGTLLVTTAMASAALTFVRSSTDPRELRTIA